MALTRGDRYFTADYTPYNLTAWGFADSQRDASAPGHGSMLGRLILRGLPGEFTENSTYAWFPLQTPESMKVFLENLGTADLYSYNRPDDPPVTAIARQYNDVRQILGSSQCRPSYGDKAARVVSGEGYVGFADESRSCCSNHHDRFFLASNNEAESQRDQREVLRVLQTSPDQAERIAQYFYERTRKLIVSKSYTLANKGVKYVDIVSEVLRYVPLYWTASELVCNREMFSLTLLTV
jgi:linoleate 10R-lipoxygenase